jgi:hypothetical protein
MIEGSNFVHGNEFQIEHCLGHVAKVHVSVWGTTFLEKLRYFLNIIII